MIEIREEKISEQRETENVVREAFWNVYSPGCSDHYLVHQIRQCPAYIPQLNLVAVKNETIVGHVINIKSYISGDDGRNYEVISLGPISVLPQYQRTGVGSKLISEVKKIAKQSGYRAILLYGNPAFYLKQGFEPAEVRHGGYRLCLLPGRPRPAPLALLCHPLRFRGRQRIRLRL